MNQCLWYGSGYNPYLIWIRNPDSDSGRQKWRTKKKASLITWNCFNCYIFFVGHQIPGSWSGFDEYRYRSKTLTWRVFCFCWLPWGMLLCSVWCWGGSLLSPPAASERWPAAGWDPTPACSAQQHPAAQHQHLNQSSRHISLLPQFFKIKKWIIYFKLCNWEYLRTWVHRFS